MSALMEGAGLGAVASVILEKLIKEIKTVLAFEDVFKELVTKMEDLEPIVAQIESLQGGNDLMTLKETIDKARALVDKCKGVHQMNVVKKNMYTKKMWKIQREMVSFCQFQMQLLQNRNQLQSADDILKKLDNMMTDIDKKIQAVNEKLDRLIDTINNNNQQVNKKMDDNHQAVVAKIDLLIPPPDCRPLCSVPKLDKAPVGFDWTMRDLKKMLLEDSVNCLVVSGASGRGKTTLVTQLCHDARIKGKFKHRFFNVVSPTPNIRKLVQNLYQHNGHTPPTFADNDEAIYGLQELLKKLREDGPILMVLDDVWPGAESLLEKFKPADPHGYKILVTSQFKFPSFGSSYELNPLDHGDAKVLLIQWASRPPYASDAEYEHLLKKILERCNGFPIVIEVVGGSLEGKSLKTWKDKVESWSKEETVLDNHHASVLECLQSSFNDLESNLKECFLDMGSFLDPQKKIYASVIIDIWVELYGKGSSSSVYMKYLKDLGSKNLLKLIPLGRKEPEDGFYNEFLVTQHDTLRELAIRQSKLEAIMERKIPNLERREDNLPEWFPSELEASQERKRLVSPNLETREDNSPDWRQSKLEAIRQSKLEEILERKRLNFEIRGDKFPDWCLDLKKPVNARLLSIYTDDLFSSNWVEMEFPNVEALVLNISSSSYALPSFIETTEKLKVVIIINHGFYLSRLSNFPYLSSLPNLKRIRLEKVSITFLDILRLQLDSLKKFSLVMCTFGEVSHDTKEIVDVSKDLPSLEEIDIDYCYDLVELPSWISQVVSLKALSITNCNKLSKLPEAIGNLSKLEVLRLCSCICLSELPETTSELNNLLLLDISGCFQLKKFPLKIGNLQKLEKIWMRDCYRSELPDSVKNLENLEVKCDEGTEFVWKRFRQKMKNLTVLVEETEHNLNFLQQF